MTIQDAVKNIESFLPGVQFTGTLMQINEMSKIMIESMEVIKSTLTPKEVKAEPEKKKSKSL